MSQRRQALGRGLGALMGEANIRMDDESPEGIAAKRHVKYVSIEDIDPNPYQPRKRFSQDALRELSDSIREHGVLQPILVARKAGSDSGYVLLAGERRFRASQLAELNEIPALVTEATEEEMLEIAIVENVQRDDLNPIEEAQAYAQLIETFGWSQEQVSRRVGKKRSTVSNSIRLLKLPSNAQVDLQEGRITAGHARALLAIDDEKEREKLRMDIISRGLSVREAEQRVLAVSGNRGEKEEAGPSGKKKNSSNERLDTVALEERLLSHLGCRVRINSRDGKSGKLEIPFQDPDDLQRFLDAIGLPD